jgi:hypothetical protein
VNDCPPGLNKLPLVLASALMCLLVSGCDNFTGHSLTIGGTVEAADSNGICGEYLGFKIKHIIRDYSDGKLYSIGGFQPVIPVGSCWDFEGGNEGD